MNRPLLIIIAFIVLSCDASRSGDVHCPDIIPFPNEIEMGTGTCCVKGAEVICPDNLDTLTSRYLADFAAQLSEIAGHQNSRTKIVFEKSSSLSSEQYKIRVTPRRISVKASGHRGFVYAVQTLKQMLPIAIYGKSPASEADWNVPCCTINDSPRFAYRGMLLDVSRHFSIVDEVKKFIDMLEIHKMNVFHWHLTDDQGWRIEIKKYPKLTEIGSIRKQTLIGHHQTSTRYDGIPYGKGLWYSQDQIREIVSYASLKGITVIPEIDLPGHMLGALASYPELGCTGGPYEVWDRWGVSDDVLCAGKDEVYDFLDNVLEEVCSLFTSEYIHIGGDECPKTRWEACPHCQSKIRDLGLKDDEKHLAEHYLQSYVMRHVSEFLTQHGKKIIGWEEMLQGELPAGSTVMAWRKTERGLEAARLGHDAIMTTRPYLYLDRYQCSDHSQEPLAIGGCLPVEKVWSFDPYQSEDIDCEVLTNEQKDRVIGVQANIWREYIPTNEHLEYMIYPRIAAVSEVQWCLPDNKNWERFRLGLDKLKDVYDLMGYEYARHIWQDE